MTEIVSCPHCLKVTDLCVCDKIQKTETKLHVLILQHPQEPDKDLGSARLANLSLPNSTLKIGLSWPNLKVALGREAQPSRWAVLYLGSGVQGGAGLGPMPTAPKASAPQIIFVDKKARPSEHPPAARDLDGIVILDGTWSQAKALWWRNAWLLKLRRGILRTQRPSLYRELRREPRRECLSTIESIAEALTALGENSATADRLRETFSALLDKKRAQLAQSKAQRKAERQPPKSAV